MNLGNINMARLEGFAKASGITKDELEAALAARRLNGISFSSSS